MTDIDIGTSGEKFFSNWCSKAGITCNKSIEDKEAWDFIIEFDNSNEDSSTFDENKPRHKCFIQVKSSNDTTSNRSIKLRNWDKMVKDSSPVFILRVEYDNLEDPQRVYLIHVGEELITKTMKKLRGITNKEKYKLKGMMIYPRQKKDLIEAFDGKSLKEALQKKIKQDAFGYTNWKTELVKTVGYEAEEVVFTVKSLEGKTPIEQMMDFTIGKTQELDTIEVKTRRKRFGTFSEYISLGPARIKVDVTPSSKVRLELQSEDLVDTKNLQLDLYAPSAVSNVPKHELKFLVKDEYLSLEINYKTERIELKYDLPDPNKEIDIKLLESASSLLTLLNRSEVRGTKLKGTLFIDDKKWLHFYPTLKIVNEQYVLEHAAAIYNALKVFKHFNFTRTKLKPNILINQEKRFNFLVKMIERENFWLRLEFWALDKLPEKEMGIIFPFELLTHNYKLIQGIYLVGHAKVKGKKHNKIDYEISSENFYPSIKLLLKSDISKKKENRELKKIEAPARKKLEEKGIDDILFIEND
ncbi:MAG: hypothetical protein RLN81_14660 [Balneolaceae bacterium]